LGAEGETVRFHVRSVAAHCECGAEDFQPLSPGDLSASALFVCTVCRREHTRFDLLMQISRQVIKVSHEYLENLRVRRRSADDDAPG
jgi:hypothetical protein